MRRKVKRDLSITEKTQAWVEIRLKISASWILTQVSTLTWSYYELEFSPKKSARKKLQNAKGALKKKYRIIKGLFNVLGPKEHFWFLQKFSLFVNILA